MTTSSFMAMRAVIFDLDGTLVDSLPGIRFSLAEAFAAENLPPFTGDLAAHIGPPMSVMLSRLLPAASEPQRACLEAAFRRSYDSGGWLQTALLPGTQAAVEQLHAAGLPLFVATNKPSLASNRILEHLGLRRYFTDVFCRDTASPPFADKAAMLISLATRHGLSADRSLYIGDTADDATAGARAGMHVILVRYSSGFTAPHSVPVLSGLAELIDLLQTKEIA